MFERKAKGFSHNCGREQPSWKSSGWFPVFWIPCAAWAWACASSRCGLLVRDPSTSTKSCMTHHHAHCTPGWSAEEGTRQRRPEKQRRLCLWCPRAALQLLARARISSGSSRPEPLIQPVSSHSLCKQQLKPAHPPACEFHTPCPVTAAGLC